MQLRNGKSNTTIETNTYTKKSLSIDEEVDLFVHKAVIMIEELEQLKTITIRIIGCAEFYEFISEHIELYKDHPKLAKFISVIKERIPIQFGEFPEILRVFGDDYEVLMLCDRLSHDMLRLLMSVY